ncbi:hypothetical protein LguiA_013061 [Lonicera macranthoides]
MSIVTMTVYMVSALMFVGAFGCVPVYDARSSVYRTTLRCPLLLLQYFGRTATNPFAHVLIAPREIRSSPINDNFKDSNV